MTIIELAAIIAGYSMAFFRVAGAMRWGWVWLPPWLQILVPAAVTAIPALVAQLGGVATRIELIEALVVFLGALGTAWRGGMPKDNTPPGGRVTPVVPFEPVREKDIKPLHFGALALGLALLACAPSQWQAQAPAANAVASAANDIAYPQLERLYTEAGLSAIAASTSPEDARVRLSIVREQWAPIWNAWDAFAAAQNAWATAIETDGDPLTTGAAVREAFCRLRADAAPKLLLPDFPVPGLECAYV